MRTQLLARGRGARCAYALLVSLWGSLALVAQTSRDVMLSTSSDSKLVLAIRPLVIHDIDPTSAARELSSTLATDLSASNVFRIVAPAPLPAKLASANAAWQGEGVDWVLSTDLRLSAGELKLRASVEDARVGAALFDKTYRSSSSLLYRMAHLLSDDLVKAFTGKSGVAASRIVFCQNEGVGIKEIWQIDPDGGHPLRLTQYRSLTISPSVAPDGKLAYVTYVGGSPEIWGQRRPGGPHIRLVTPDKRFPGHCYCPSWSPDGSRLAFTQVVDRLGNTDLMILDLKREQIRRLTFNHCSNTDPAWSPAGNELAFTSDQDGTPQLYLIEVDGTHQRRLTTNGEYNTSPVWSPSGRMIAYVSRFEDRFDLFVYKLDERKAYQVVVDAPSTESPTWSPDERGLAFSSGSKGGMKLFIASLNGNEVRQVIPKPGCEAPKWTRSR